MYRTSQSRLGTHSGAVVQEILDQTLSENNIRSLVYFFGIQLDRRLALDLAGTPFHKLRASDGRVFIGATRGLKTISAIARHLQVSRQSTQSSVSRLVKFGLLNLVEHPTSKREKLVIVTDLGGKASSFAIAQLRKIENELARALGAENYANLRRSLEMLVRHGSIKTAEPHL